MFPSRENAGYSSPTPPLKRVSFKPQDTGRYASRAMREAIEAETDFIWQQSKVLPAFTRVFFKTVLIFSNRYIPSSRVSRGCVGFLDLTLGGGYNAWIRTDRNPG